MSRVYVASKAKHGSMWIAMRDSQDVNIISSWIDLYEPGDIQDWRQFWLRCVAEVRSADYLLAAHFEDDGAWKGALVEIGVALALDTPVLLVGEPPGTWIEHPGVTRVTMNEALEILR